MLYFKIAVRNVHKDCNANQKSLKKPNCVYFAKNLPLEALLLREVQLTKQHMLEKDQGVSFHSALRGKRPK